MKSVKKLSRVSRLVVASASVAWLPGVALGQFADTFNNGSIPDADTRPAFWNQVVDGNGLYTETAGGNKVTLRTQSGGPGNAFPYTQLASPLQNDFNFFRAPIVVEASGLGYAAGDSILGLTQFTITSQALDSAGPQTEYQAEDAFSLWITNRTTANNGTGVGTLVVGTKQDSVNRSTAFEGYPLIGEVGNVVRAKQTFAGQVRGFKLVLGPTFFDLTITRDTSTTNATQVSVHYTGGLDIYRVNSPFGANWNSPGNPQGDSAVNIQTQLNNTPSTTPVANFSMSGFSVTKFQQTWAGNSFDNWSNTSSWSDANIVHLNGDGNTNSVPNFIGANVRFAQATGPVTVISDVDHTVGAMIFDSTQPYTVTVNGGGQGTLHLATRYTAAELRVIRGSHSILAPVIFEGGSDALLTADEPSAVLSIPTSFAVADPATQNITMTGSGRVEIPAARANTLTLTGGTLRILANAGNTPGLAAGLSDVVSVVPGAGLLDLSNNDMIVRTGVLEDLRALVAAWYANGSRNGPGIGSSLSTVGSHTTLAVISNDAGGFPFFSNFDGSAVSTSDLLIKYTYNGDTNLDGVVDGIDIARVIEGYSTGQTGWQWGDVDYSGAVTASDVQAVLAAFSGQGAPIPASGSGGGGSGGAIPEPAGLAVILPATLALRRTRRVR